MVFVLPSMAEAQEPIGTEFHFIKPLRPSSTQPVQDVTETTWRVLCPGPQYWSHSKNIGGNVQTLQDRFVFSVGCFTLMLKENTDRPR